MKTEKPNTFGILKGIEGVKVNREVPCIHIKHSRFINSINLCDYAYVASGNNGSLNIYKDDSGFIRCEAMKHYITFDKKIFDTLTEAKKWFGKTYLKIQ